MILLSNSPSLAVFGIGDVVFDPARYAQQAAQWAEEIKKWENIIKLYKQQIALLKGSKKYGMTTDQVYSNLPKTWEEFLPYADNNLKHTQNINNNKTEFLLNQYELLISTFNESKIRLERIQNLVSAINQTEGPKESQDLSNRLQIEILLMQENQNRLESINKIIEMENKLSERAKILEQKCSTELFGNRLYNDLISEECQNFIQLSSNQRNITNSYKSQNEYIGDNGGWNLGQTSENMNQVAKVQERLMALKQRLKTTEVGHMENTKLLPILEQWINI